MKSIKLVILDMAGTTVNEDNVVYKTLQKVINDLGFNIPLDTVLELGAGKEKLAAIEDILQQSTNAEDIHTIAKKAYAALKGELEKAYQELEVTTFDGVELLFRDLRSNGIKVVLNTGYDRHTATQLLNKLNWKVGEIIDAAINADDVTNGRPNPDMIYLAMEMFGITNASEVLKGGDSVIDIEEGKNANCGITVGVLSGAQTREQLATANPSYILNDVSELRDILLG